MPTPQPNSEAHVSELKAAFAQRLAQRDRDGAIQAGLDAVRQGRIGIADLYTQVLGPLMVDTGEHWQSGDVRVWEEHFATQTVRSLVESLTPEVVIAASAVPSAGKRVLMACPPGEQHDLGLRMLSDRFRLAGWDVFYLGTDTPVEEIIEASRTLDADMVVLSASTHYNRVLLRDVAGRIRAELPNVQLGVGGPAFCLDRQWPHEELLDPADLGLPGTPPPAEESA